MTKYRPIIKAEIVYNDVLEDNVHLPHITLYEDEDGEPTGILDKHGNELARYSKGPLGFCR